jgi:hypothetical protein
MEHAIQLWACLGVFDGAYAVDTVVRPCLEPVSGQCRIEIVTRRRADARLYHPAGRPGEIPTTPGLQPRPLGGGQLKILETTD